MNDTEAKPSYWTHGDPPQVHDWQYLGKIAQAYRCAVCGIRVSKVDLKKETDA